MAKWIGEARAAENNEEGDVVAEPEPVVSNTHAAAWKPVTLTKLILALNTGLNLLSP